MSLSVFFDLGVWWSRNSDARPRIISTGAGDSTINDFCAQNTFLAVLRLAERRSSRVLGILVRIPLLRLALRRDQRSSLVKRLTRLLRPWNIVLQRRNQVMNRVFHPLHSSLEHSHSRWGVPQFKPVQPMRSRQLPRCTTTNGTRRKHTDCSRGGPPLPRILLQTLIVKLTFQSPISAGFHWRRTQALYTDDRAPRQCDHTGSSACDNSCMRRAPAGFWSVCCLRRGTRNCCLVSVHWRTWR
jgi:hypothetical protein